MMITGTYIYLRPSFVVSIQLTSFPTKGDHPKTAEAIARKINLVIGDTKESLAARTDRTPDEVTDGEVDAIVVHGDDIDGLHGWQWDQSPYLVFFLSFPF